MNEHNNNPVANINATDDDASFIPSGRSVPIGNAVSWLSSAWDMFKQSPGAWIALFVIFFVLTSVVSLIPVIGFFNMLLYPLFLGGIMIACERQRESGSLTLGDLFAGFQSHLGPLCIQGLLTFALSLLVIIPIGILAAITLGGAFFTNMSASGGPDLSALPIFGIMALAFITLAAMSLVYAAAWYAPALIVLQGLSPVEAMKSSFAGCMKNWLSGLIYFLCAMVLLFIGMIPLGLGLLIVCPLLFAAIYTSYRDIYIEE